MVQGRAAVERDGGAVVAEAGDRDAARGRARALEDERVEADAGDRVDREVLDDRARIVDLERALPRPTTTWVTPWPAPVMALMSLVVGDDRQRARVGERPGADSIASWPAWAAARVDRALQRGRGGGSRGLPRRTAC